jgi:hypothetical protein
MRFLRKWANADAKWWQFWMPQSGHAGGLIIGAIVLSGILLYEVFK